MSLLSGQSHISIQLGAALVEADVCRSGSARTTRIQLGRDMPLRIIVPDGASDEYAVQALRNKSDWILKKLQTIEEARRRPDELGLDRREVVWMHGAALEVLAADVHNARLDDAVLLAPRSHVCASIQRWYRRTARSWLCVVVAEEADRLGVEVTSVSVRDQRTRWGSCSRGGHISLNWRLLLAPENVARYVTIHELVHTRVPNHSRAFWRQLGLACPEWRKAADWLTRHGDEVRRYQYRSGRAASEQRLHKWPA